MINSKLYIILKGDTCCENKEKKGSCVVQFQIGWSE